MGFRLSRVLVRRGAWPAALSPDLGVRSQGRSMWRAGQVRDSGPVLLGAAFQSNQSPFLEVRGPLLGWGWGPRGDSRHMSLLCGEHRLRRQERGSRKLSQASCRPNVATDCMVLAASRCGLQRESSYPRKGTAPRTALGPGRPCGSCTIQWGLSSSLPCTGLCGCRATKGAALSCLHVLEPNPHLCRSRQQLRPTKVMWGGGPLLPTPQVDPRATGCL